MGEDLNRQRVLNFLDVYYAGASRARWSAAATTSRSRQCSDRHPAAYGQHRGKPLRQMWTTIHERYSDMRYEAPAVVAEGDKVAAQLRVFFRKRNNRRVVQFDVAVFYTLRDGKITEIREIIDTFDLVQQVLERDVAAALTGQAVS